MISFIKFLRLAISAYRSAQRGTGICHAALRYRGLPYLSVYVALDRHAWELENIMENIMEENIT